MSDVNAVYPVDLLLPDKWWRLVNYRLREVLSICGVDVPRGFVTDGASVPRLFWIFFPPVCRYFPAAVVHDYLLKQGVSWRVANRKFREALIELKVSRWRRRAMMASVGVYAFYRETVYGE